MKKTLAIVFLALALLMSGAMAEINLSSAMPVTNEAISLTIAVVPQSGAQNFTPGSNWMCQYIDKYSGLDIEWMIIDPAAAAERLPVILNSGDMPDAIIGYSFSVNDIVQYGMSAGILYPINELLEYAPTFAAYLEANPAARAALTAPDGNIYGFPALPNVWSYKLRNFVNTKWLERVGLENPTTLDEFKEMLIAFRDQDANGNGDLNDEVPLVGCWNSSSGAYERGYILLAYGYVLNGGKENIAIDYNGDEPVIVYLPYAERYKDYLIYMNDLWNEQLLDPDLFTQAETDAQAKVLAGVNGFSGMSAPYVWDPENQDDWTAASILVDNEGDTPIYPGPNTIYTMSRVFINADCDELKAAALANLADFFYTLEGWGFATYGPEAGTELDWNNTGHYFDPETKTIQYNMPADMTSAWTHRITYLTIYSNPGFNSEGYDVYRLKYAEVYPDSAIGQFYKDGVVSRKDETDQQIAYSPYYVDPMPSLFFSAEDLERANELKLPLDDYVESMEAKFITGEISIESEWDNYIKTLEAYGVEEYLELYTKYYEAYKAN